MLIFTTILSVQSHGNYCQRVGHIEVVDNSKAIDRCNFKKFAEILLIRVFRGILIYSFGLNLLNVNTFKSKFKYSFKETANYSLNQKK